MIARFLKRLLLAAFLLALQIFIFNHIQIMGFATPMIFIYPLLIFSADTHRLELLCWGFGLGMVEDMFSNTPGMNAAALTFTAMARPTILKLFTLRDMDEDKVELPISATMLGWRSFIGYVATTVILHQALYYILEFFSFEELPLLGLSIVAGSLMTLCIIACMEGLRNGTRK